MKIQSPYEKKKQQDQRNRERLKSLSSGRTLREILLAEGKTDNMINAILKQWLRVGKIDQQEYDDNMPKEKPEVRQVLPESVGDAGDLPFEAGVFFFGKRVAD